MADKYYARKTEAATSALAKIIGQCFSMGIYPHIDVLVAQMNRQGMPKRHHRKYETWTSRSLDRLLDQATAMALAARQIAQIPQDDPAQAETATRAVQANEAMRERIRGLVLTYCELIKGKHITTKELIAYIRAHGINTTDAGKRFGRDYLGNLMPGSGRTKRTLWPSK